MITTTPDGSLSEVLEALTPAKDALPDAQEGIDADAAPVNLNDSLAAVAATVVARVIPKVRLHWLLYLFFAACKRSI
jgi:hypothetical protein